MFLELSVPVYPGMPRGDDSLPDMEVMPQGRIAEGAANNITAVKLFLHGGSHVDAPQHFDPAGQTIDRIPISSFVYDRPLVADLRERRGGRIRRSDLACIPGIEKADLLLLYTGCSEWIGDPVRYPVDYPTPDESAAEFLRRELPSLVAVGTDAISIEYDDGSHRFPIHHELLDGAHRQERTLLIYENLDLTKAVGAQLRRVYAFPMRLRGLEASPVAMVAELRER